MHASFFLKALIGITVIIEAAEVQLHSRSYRLLDRRQKGRGGGGNGRGKGGGGQGQAGNNGKGNGNGNNDLELDPSVINTGSQITGLEKNADPGQAPSVPSQNNNINFCSGKTITDGLQNKDGSCNPGMGDIPNENNMVSAAIISPKTCENLPANKKITITARFSNINFGTFTNPDNTYYAGMQELLSGQVIGHTHIVVQNTGNSFDTDQPLSAKKFAFFKGVNDAGTRINNKLVSVSEDIDDGLPTGCYEVCTMTGAANHQAVVMPIAQRGPQDRCQKFSVGNANCGCTRNDGNGNQGNGNGNQGKGKGDQGNGNGNQGNGNGNQGNGNDNQSKGNGNQGNGKGNQGNGQRQGGQQQERQGGGRQ